MLRRVCTHDSEEPELIEDVGNTLNNPNSSHEKVHKEGSNFLSYLYGAKEGEETDLNYWRYIQFSKCISKEKFNLNSIPRPQIEV